MARPAYRSLALSCFVLAGAPALAQADVWTVDDDAPADFATIQAAVDAAAPGDLVLVRAGTYANFTLAGKGPSIVGDEGADVIVLGASGANASVVSGVPAGQRALLRGLTFLPPNQIAENTLRITNCAGAVWIENVSVVAVPAVPFIYSLNESDAVEITDSAQVLLVDVTIVGGTGAAPGAGLEGGQNGLSIAGSEVHLLRCEVHGGATVVQGGSGRIGTRVEQSFVSLRDTVSRGGVGGIGFVLGAPPGTGGPGMTISAGSEVWSIGSQLLGGPGGSDVFGGASGPSGPPYTNAGGALVERAATNVGFDTMALVRDDEDAQFHVETEPASPLFLAVSFATTPLFVSAFPGLVAVGLDPILVPIGTTSGLGSLDFEIGIPSLPPGFSTWDVTLQIAAVVGSVVEISNPSIATVVDDAF